MVLGPGDLVLSRDEHTGAQSPKRVVRTMVHQASELVHVRTATDTITATPNHPFWVCGRGWVDAGALASGDTLVLADGGRADIDSVTREKLSSPVDVYNLEVEDYHTYFVASTGVWVHNCGGQGGAKVVEDLAAGASRRITGWSLGGGPLGIDEGPTASHVYNRLLVRGFSEEWIDDTVNTGRQLLQDNGRYRYFAPDGSSAVLAPNGTVITVMRP